MSLDGCMLFYWSESQKKEKKKLRLKIGRNNVSEASPDKKISFNLK